MKKISILCYCIIALAAFAAWAPDVLAMSSFESPGAEGLSCSDCHPALANSGPGDANHVAHGEPTGQDCASCHVGSFNDPPIGVNCTRCHGRAQDAGGDGLSAGEGRGLRQHHQNSGASDCGLCHSDATGPVGVGEDVPPAFYPGVGAVPLDPCDGSEESFPSNTVSLDNDGDLLTDGADPDCAPPAECGNGIIEAGEECDDGNILDGDCCSANCTFEAAGSPCPDGEFCNGDETCDGAGACQAGTPVDCSDGVGCTDDSCDEVNDVCVNAPNDANCPDDGLFCNGTEFCDAELDCTSTGDPCPVGTVCNEGTDTCDPAEECGNGIVEGNEECDDGNLLDGDCCSANCTFEAAGSPCPDGQFCNGDETCDGAGTCQAGTPVDCDDGVGCTVDSCDEVNDVCVNTPDDAACDDGQFCNGAEICDPDLDCQPGTPVDCDDGVGCTDDSCDEDADACVNVPNDANCPDDGLFCNGMEFCDAQNDCSSTGDPCPMGTVCIEETGTCDPVAGCGDGIVDPGEECDDGNTMDGDCCSANCTFEPAGSPCPDGEFCNGEETCDGAGTCIAGTPVDCDDGIDCTVDSCDEVNDTCVNTPNDNNCPDDGLFCTGQEICDPVIGCVSTGDPCPAGTTCNEDTDSCDQVDNKVTICHKGKKTKSVNVDAVPAHLAHGDTLGACPE